MNRARRPGLEHPLAQLFARAVDSITVALHPSTVGNYHGSVRHFLVFLQHQYPEVCRLDQLRRDPHILGWLAHLRSATSPSAAVSSINRLGHIRRILNELAWTGQLPELAQLLLPEDVPRMPQRLPRPLTAQHDALLQQEFLRRNDLGSNALLLLRHTGMRIGECADLPCDCLHSTGPEQWAIHVPLGKMKTERMVPVDDFVRQLVLRLRFFRSLDPLPADGLLLARPLTKGTVIRQLRDYLHKVCFDIGLPTNIVPHQLRHTYATEMLRSGVSFPSVMKLLGHSSPDMTMLYVDITLTDLQREFHRAHASPRHLVPQPRLSTASLPTGKQALIDSLLSAQHSMEMFRRSLLNDAFKKNLDRLGNRLSKIIAILRKLDLT